MNGDDYQGPTLNEFNPSWMEDGGGITGEQGEPNFDSNQGWDTNAWSRENYAGEDFSPAGGAGGCMSDAGDPPAMGTYVLGSIDGVCQWIGKTDCT